MPDISTIRVTLQTMRANGAGTDGDVYLGIGGREFYLDTSADDFESGSSRTYVLGAGGNTLHPQLNDPRSPRLRTEDLQRFPVYVRFHPKGRDDNWFLQRATVNLNDDIVPAYDSAETMSIRGGVWLGARAGQAYHLAAHAH
ncbi:hypothetical protein [Thalassiella azotivora]